MQPVILVIGWIEKTGLIGVFVFLSGLFIIFVRRHIVTRDIREELEGCILMVSKCSQLICLLKLNPYATELDIDFLRSKLNMNYFRIYNTAEDVVLSDNERHILNDASFWLRIADERIGAEGGETGDSSERKSMDIKGSRNEITCPCGAVLSIALSRPIGIRQENEDEQKEWIYYMWLVYLLMQAMCNDNSANRKELGDLCNRIEKWMEDSSMGNSRYLKDKIKECREWLAAG